MDFNLVLQGIAQGIVCKMTLGEYAEKLILEISQIKLFLNEVCLWAAVHFYEFFLFV